MRRFTGVILPDFVKIPPDALHLACNMHPNEGSQECSCKCRGSRSIL